jgi:hypothetical protein
VVCARAVPPAASTAPARRTPPKRENPRRPPALLSIVPAMIGSKFITLNSIGIFKKISQPGCMM